MASMVQALNKIRIALKEDQSSFLMDYSQNSLRLIHLFKEYNIIRGYRILHTKNCKMIHVFAIPTNVFSMGKRYKPTNKFYIKRKHLEYQVVKRKKKCLLSSSYGLMDQYTANKKRKSGLLLAEIMTY